MNYRIVWKNEQAVLVEWRGTDKLLSRAILPAAKVGAELSEAELCEGIPFGVSWLLPEKTLPELTKRLHEQGIWTYADAANRIRDFRSIVNEIVVASLLDAARGGR